MRLLSVSLPMSLPPFFDKFRRWIPIGLSILLGAVFLYAGALKVHDPWKFADAIYAFKILPKSVITLLALTLPMLEILTGLLLITGWKRRLGALCVLLMTTVFAAAIISALARGLIINCSCFGEIGVPTRVKLWTALGRDVILFIVAVIVKNFSPIVTVSIIAIT